MNQFTGLWALIRLALRRDRIKLSVWILGIAGLIAVGIPSLAQLYNTPEKVASYVATTGSSIIGRLFGGPIDGPNLGSIVMVEYFLFACVLMAFMSTLLVVRHTRQNEETGRSELIGSMIVGRHAALTAAIIVAGGANLLVGMLITVFMIAGNLPVAGSVSAGVSLALTGLFFTGAAAVLAQVTESARAANSLSALAIGIAFLLRGIGDSLGTFVADKGYVASAWPSWLSPMGWGQQIHPFTSNQTWVLVLYPLAFLLLVCLAFYLTSKRDVGSGLLPTRAGVAQARPGLLSPHGLAVRLQRGVLIGWSLGIIVMGVTVGMVSVEFKNFLQDNEQYAELIQSLGGSAAGNMTDTLFGTMFVFMGLMISGYAIQALLRLRSEEANGYVEAILATSVGRYRWMLSHILTVFTGIVIVVLLAGLSTGISYYLIADVAASEISRLTLAAFAQLTPILVLAGLTIAVCGLCPRWATVLAWGSFGLCVLVGQVGAALNLPQWVLNLSPFTHAAAAPAESLGLRVMVTFVLLAMVFLALGLVAFRRRDLVTN